MSKDWSFRGKVVDDDFFTKVCDAGFLGFIYEITEEETGKKYIGKKGLLRKYKRKLKGSTRNTITWKESDWRTYHGSSPVLMERVASGEYTYDRQILLLCRGKADMMYYEVKHQLDKNVVFDENYYNQMLHIRCSGRGITLPDDLEKQNEELLNDH